MKMGESEVLGGSFRDPSGFVFRYEGDVYRQVNESYASTLEKLESSGLYAELVEAGLLVDHQDAAVPAPGLGVPFRILRPRQVPFVSYPYEWCFGQMKDAALATLDVQGRAIRRGLSLKDASAFNIQFFKGRPTLIDTLSFESYAEGRAWVAYRQFCEHFLAPLLLIRHVDPWLARLAALTVDGIPLRIASKLLPWRTVFHPTALIHVHLHARSIGHFGGQAVPKRLKERGLSRNGMVNLIEGLQSAIHGIRWAPEGTEWAEYEDEHRYAEPTQAAKRQVLGELVAALKPGVVWDLGANAGEFSRIAAAHGADVLSIDIDPAAVERNYLRTRERGETNILPLCIDLTNPSSDLGWAGKERSSLTKRSNADVVLALALVHHLAIGANVPFRNMAAWFASLAPNLVIEFVPKTDEQAQRLLLSRDDVFDDYTRPAFEASFRQFFDLCAVHELPQSDRVIYHCVRRA
jgi:hypothetical protein